ncbi:histidine kinase N-terminal 7TM domain-containing protein [Halobaculum sp. MBLA0147]|uniref:sensor histidine kinase n=1 Tax=Halobaculum sp. MBLA0147 TaxID=3079934 RepID=UPI003524E7B4
MIVARPVSSLAIAFLGVGGLLSLIAVFTHLLGEDSEVAEWFEMLLVADAAWAFASVLPLEAGSVPVAFVGEAIRVATSSIAATAWVTFALVYTGRTALVTPRRIALLAAPFVVHVLAVTTSPLHGLAVRNLTVEVAPVVTVVSYELGPTFLVATAYSLVLTVIGLFLVARTALSDTDLYTDQSVALVVGSVMPVVGVVLTATGDVFVGSTNATPLTLAVTGVGYGYALFRTDLLSSGPLIASTGREVAIDSLEEGFLILDGNDRVVDANDAAAAVLETTDPVGEPARTVFPDALPTDGAVTQQAESGRLLRVSVTPIEDGVGRAVTVRDVSERERRRERLGVLNRVLRHNLRNELMTIRGYAESLDDETPIPREEAVDRIGSKLDDLDDLVENVRTLDRLLSVDETAEREPVHVGRVLEGVVERAVDDYDGQVAVETAFDVAPTTAVETNERILETVLAEVVENALVHNDTETPTLETRVTETDDAVRVVVADDGPGIPEQDRRAVTTGEESPLEHGSRLGLWVVRWGTRYLGGEFRIESRDGRGTRVIVDLPQ